LIVRAFARPGYIQKCFTISSKSSSVAFGFTILNFTAVSNAVDERLFRNLVLIRCNALKLLSYSLDPLVKLLRSDIV
jgi:hypothetical protein